VAEVFINRVTVGELRRDEPVNRFTYREGIAPGQAVSLLMPVGDEPYFAERATVLHPVFDMSLPEGALRDVLIAMFSKALPVFDDLALLEVVGRSLIGRLRFGTSAAELDRVPAQSLSELLKYRGTADLFRDLLARYAQYSGVAGVQPKLLIRDDGSLKIEELSPPVEKRERITTHGTTHLLKTFDATKFPALAVNEYRCLQAAKRAGLIVPPALISEDSQTLVIGRFDLKADGSYLAFEDGCAIDGRLSRDKYEGSYEQLAGTLASVLKSPAGLETELARFFRILVFSIATRNGDAHRKNFGVIYDDATAAVTLAPAFDLVTTTAYLPKDSLALMLDGSKSWPEYKRVHRFGIQRCRLSPKAASDIIAEVVDAVATEEAVLAHDIPPDSGEVIPAMRSAWREGVKFLNKK